MLVLDVHDSSLARQRTCTFAYLDDATQYSCRHTKTCGISCMLELLKLLAVAINTLTLDLVQNALHAFA